MRLDPRTSMIKIDTGSFTLSPPQYILSEIRTFYLLSIIFDEFIEFHTHSILSSNISTQKAPPKQLGRRFCRTYVFLQRSEIVVFLVVVQGRITLPLGLGENRIHLAGQIFF